ncbi:hypothetical protein FOB22_004230 [Saccharomyces cerevisiae]|nr:hypothetical protein FOB22_004230 [Saccharomyces cerevisiae]
MLRNDEEYKEYLEDIEPYHGDPVGYLKYFSVKRREIYSNREIMLGTWPLLEEEKQLVYWIRQEASKGAKFSACLEGRSKSCIIKKLEYLLEQISEVWLLPHWLDLTNVEVLAADDTRVPLYMLMVAVHKELDSDDVPDGRFDILLCRDSSREVGE